jgi:hypothetical protein
VRSAALVAAAGALVAACGGEGKDALPPSSPTVVAPAPPPEDRFGARFGLAFRAASTADPIAPMDGDIIPLSVTTDPIELG